MVRNKSYTIVETIKQKLKIMKNQTEVNPTYLALTEKCKEVRLAKKEATKLRRENQALKEIIEGLKK